MVIQHSDVIAVFHGRLYDGIKEIKGNPEEKKFIEQIKASIFLEAVLAIVKM